MNASSYTAGCGTTIHHPFPALHACARLHPGGAAGQRKKEITLGRKTKCTHSLEFSNCARTAMAVVSLLLLYFCGFLGVKWLWRRVSTARKYAVEVVWRVEG